jgi:hypothetical protein
MAAGFAGGVAALTWSRFPKLTPAQLGQVLRNTARPARGVQPDGAGWESRLGCGILDAARAVKLKPEQLVRDVRVRPSAVRRTGGNRRRAVEARVRNHGALDAERAMVVAYNGNPLKPVDPRATMAQPAEILQVRQIGHRIVRVRGLHEAAVRIALTETPAGPLWFETYCLDRDDPGHVHRTRAALRQG